MMTNVAPHKIERKMTSKHGKEVKVFHTVSVSKDGLHVFKLEAVCGSSIHRHTITLGAVDGKRPELSEELPKKEIIQKILDDARQECADHASWKEHIKNIVSSIK